MNLNEAFRALDALNEDTFSVSDDGIAKLAEFQQNDDLIDEIRVIDVDAETEDDLEDSYVGKVILDCNVCHSKLYKDKEEIELNEDETLANVGEECPFCYTSDGFKVIGEVATFGGTSEDDADDDEITDDKGTSPSTEDNDSSVEESLSQTPAEEDITDPKSESASEALTEDVNNVNVETDESIVNVNTDDSGKVTVTTEPKVADAKDGEEVIVPLTDETQSAIQDAPIDNIPLDDEDGSMDISVDEFDEQSFDELGESYLKETYDNVESYRTTDVSSNNDSIMVEGVIKFTSGAEKKTSFIFEAKDCTKSGKYRFIGENTQLTKGKKAFTIGGKIEEGKFITESFNYNYQEKDSEGNSTRIYGSKKR